VEAPGELDLVEDGGEAVKWNKKDAERLFDQWAQGHGEADDVLALADLAVDLVRVLGGTMTAEQLARLPHLLACGSPDGAEFGRRVIGHSAAQGARVAELEAEVERLNGEAWEAAVLIQGMVEQVESLQGGARRIMDERDRAEDGSRRLAMETINQSMEIGGLVRECGARDDKAREIQRKLEVTEKERDALKAELARLRPSGQVAEDEAMLLALGEDGAVPDGWTGPEWRNAVRRLAAGAQGREQAERERDEWQRKALETADKEWFDLQQALGLPDDGLARSVLDVRDAAVTLRRRARNAGLEEARTIAQEVRKSAAKYISPARVAMDIACLISDAKEPG
jgi:hypothetical protein